jgi:hypothetical protein
MGMSEPRNEAQRYALLLERGTWFGQAALVISFAVYVFGFVPPHVPLDQLPTVWNLPVSTYLQQTNTPTGWGWTTLAMKGDFLNLIGICILAGCSLPALLALIPLYLKQNDRAYAVICALVAVVLVLAASGILTAGH